MAGTIVSRYDGLSRRNIYLDGVHTLTSTRSVEQFRVLRQQGTEAPGTGKFDKHMPEQGVYTCAGCDAPLYKVGISTMRRLSYLLTNTSGTPQIQVRMWLARVL